MKRPLAVIGFSYVGTCMLAAALPPRVWFAAGIALGLCGLLALLTRHKARGYAVCVLLACGGACMALLLTHTVSIAPALEEAGQTGEISGVVTEIRGPRSIEVYRPDGIMVAVSAREALDVRLGETFSAQVRYTRYEDGNTAPSAHMKAMQVPLRGFVMGEYSVTRPESGLDAVLIAMRERLSAALREAIPGESGETLSAMLLGETWGMTQELKDVYAAAGISHLLAISGYHVALLAGLADALLGLLRCSKRVRIPLLCAVVLLYMALVPFRPSILRAGVMLLTMQLGNLLDREADSLTSLAAAGLILCVYDPFMAVQLGFSCSFLSTLGIILFGKPLNQWVEERLGEARYPRARAFATATLCTTFCATAALLPVTLLQFDRIPLYAALTNLAAAPLIPVAMACGLLTALLGALPWIGFLALPFSAMASVATDTLNAAARIIATLPFAAPPAGAGFLPLWMAGAAVLAAVAFLVPSRKKTVACMLLCVITLMAGALSYQLMMRGAVRLTVVATEHAAVLIAVKDRQAVLLGDVQTRSDAYSVGRVLSRYPVERLELVALSPISGGRNGAVGTLLAQYDVGMAVLGENDREDERMLVSLPGTEICPWEEPAEAAVLGGDGVRLNSGGVFAEFAGIKAFILGDECDILNCIPREGRPAVAVLGEARPTGIQRLRCDFLVDCGGSGIGPAALETTLLGEPGESAAFLLKDGRIRLLEAEIG